MTSLTINIDEQSKNGQFFLNLLRQYVETYQNEVQIERQPNEDLLESMREAQSLRGKSKGFKTKQELRDFYDAL